jgi:hypothetical protein
MIRSIYLTTAVSIAMASLVHSQAIVGSWFIKNAGEAQSTAVITFLPNGIYTMAEDGNSNLDPSGRDGMERGTYTWNPSTKVLTRKTLVDTTGEWGLSDSEFKSVSVSGNKLTLVADDGEFTLDRVTSRNNGLVGGWYIATGGGSYAVVTFLTDGTYLMVEDGKRSGGGRTGVERGTYKWSPLTKAFTRKLLIDTNGTWGFSDNLKRSITIAGNRLDLTVQGEGKFMLSRVVSSK